MDNPTPETDGDEGQHKRVLRPNLILTAIAIGMLVVLIMLGNWQRNRYYEALERIGYHRLQFEEKPAVTDLGEIKGADGATERLAALQYRRAKLTGELEPDKAQLLTARYILGKRGYGIMMPMKGQKGPHARILVHLGWMPDDKVKGYIASVAAKPTRTITGRLHITPSKPVQRPTGTFAERPTWLRAYPLGIAKTVNDLEPRLLLQAGEMAVGKPMDIERLPYDGFVHPQRMAPSKHVEYAATWYGLAVTLLFVWFALSLKKVRIKD
ncbi:MAG: SURF1 family protein [Myxococcales bacterium]|nr:SURF1 family protein [Myxococcales bacterium]